MKDIITTAHREDGSRVHIDDAARRGRYRGIGHHERCELYPVFRSHGRRSSFAHMPDRSLCASPQGESVEHKTVRLQWVKFLEDQLSGCIVCTMEGRDSPHLDCPVAPSGCSEVRPEAELIWPCGVCHELHIYDLLIGARSVVTEKWQFERSVRPDITVLDECGRPLVLIEIKKSNFSENVLETASANNVPLFRVDVLGVQSFQGGLYNPQRRWYEGVDMDPESKNFLQWADSIRLPGYSSEFVSLFDEDGNLIKTTFSYSDTCDESLIPPVPPPRMGNYLLAHWSTVDCKSQTVRFHESLAGAGKSCAEDTASY